MTKSEISNGHITPLQSRAIDLLKVLLALLIVAAHSGFETHVSTGDNTQAYLTISSILFFNIFKIATPAFFFLSGYLYYRGGVMLTLRQHGHKWYSRIKTLIVPYLLWNTIALALIVVKALGPWNHLFPQYDLSQWSIADLLRGYISFYDSMPYDFPLWFIRDLLIVITLSPIIDWFISRFRCWSVVIALVLLQVLDSLFPTFSAMRLPHAFFYFICGGVVVTYANDIFSASKICHWILSYIVLCTILWFLPFNVSDYWTVKTIKLLVGVIVLAKLSILLARNSQPISRRWMIYSFFVILMHGLFVTLSHKLICSIIPPGRNLLCFLDFILIFSLLLFLPTAVAMLLDKWWPKALRLLTGGR